MILPTPPRQRRVWRCARFVLVFVGSLAMKRWFQILAISGLLLGGASQAQAGLLINLTFDPSFASSFGSNAVAAENAVQYAAQQYENLFSNPVTLNITVKGVAGTSVFGESNANFGPDVFQSYSAIRNALIADATSSGDPNQLQFVSTLPVNDPTGGNPSQDFVTFSAEGKALGLIPGNGSSNDGTVTFGAGFPFTFDPNNRAVAGEYDFIGIVEHEISEVMGRVGFTGNTGLGNGGPSFSPIDLARFNNGVRSASNQGADNYFSIDNGVTVLKYYNNHNFDGLDTVDWDSGGVDSHSNQGPDSFNQYSNSGVVNDITATDITEMNILGWNLASPLGPAPATPEPASLTLLALGALGFAGYGWRQRKRRRDSAQG